MDDDDKKKKLHERKKPNSTRSEAQRRSGGDAGDHDTTAFLYKALSLFFSSSKLSLLFCLVVCVSNF